MRDLAKARQENAELRRQLAKGEKAMAVLQVNICPSLPPGPKHYRALAMHRTRFA